MPADTPRGYTYPLYSDPAAFPAQIQTLATDMDTDVEALYDRVAAGQNMAAAHVRASLVTQAVASGTTIPATFVDELYDNTGMVNLAVNTSTLTFTQTGLYMVTGRVTFQPNGLAGARTVFINTSGAFGLDPQKSIEADTASDVVVQVTALFYEEAGNTLQMGMLQFSGSPVNTSTRTLQVARVGTT